MPMSSDPRRPSSPVAAAVCVVSAIVLILGAGGCRSRGSWRNQNDELRARVMTLEEENAALEARVAELRQSIDAAARVAGLSPDILAAVPRVTGLRIDPRSHLAASAGSDPDAGSGVVATVYLTPTDGRQRFVPLVGTLTVDCVGPSGVAGGGVRSLGRVELDPGGVSEAYRSALLGTHYTVRVPLSGPVDAASGVTVIARYVDGVTGAVLVAEVTLQR
ncbi:MAG: hypothetical protein KDA25_13050 [Phycisphaerales bacterium]|nr:hypothetical protein [Phycisphaerales bacterium]